MTLAWQISIIDDLIKENPEATIGDYARVMARMGPRQRKVSGPLKRLIWPHLSNPGRRRWPPAKIYDPKLFRLSEEERTYWKRRDENFTRMINRTSRQIKRA